MMRSSVLTLSVVAGALGLAAAPQASAATVYLDLGANAIQSGSPPAGYESYVFSWNTVGPSLNTTISDLVDSGGASTGIGLVVSDQFKGTNASGPTAPTGAAAEFWQGASDSLYLARNNAQPPDEITGGITLSNLDPASTYDFVFFGSNTNPAVFNRQIVITATGAAVTSTPEYDTVQHSSNVVSLTNIAPSVGGTIVIGVGFGPSAVGNFAYLNTIKFTETPEPASIGVLLVAAGVVMARRR